MATYVIYERGTGNIVHTHVQPDQMPIRREQLFALIGSKRGDSKLDVLVIDPAQMKSESLYRVDPKTRQLQVADGKGGGFALGGVTSLASVSDAVDLKTTYAPVPPSEKDQ